MDMMISATVDEEGETINLAGIPWKNVRVGEKFSDKFVANVTAEQAEMLIEELEYAVLKSRNEV